MSQLYTLVDLRYLMQRLRDPKTGCPWDIKQTFRSITASTIEEAYEVVDAIEQGSKEEIKEELGDLLFQIIFYNQLAEEEGSFGLEDIIHTLTAKLIRRHPHVFPGGDLKAAHTTAMTEAQINAQWESIKALERKGKQRAQITSDIALGLPAMVRAHKLQKRAASIQYDFADAHAAMQKVQEELAELSEAAKQSNAQSVEMEFGDVLFSLVNLARHLHIQPEAALRAANHKFSQRLEGVCQLADQEQAHIGQVTDKQRDKWWEAVKKQEA